MIMLKHQRPVNLNLLTIRQPVTAVLSILHRITGLILFLSLPLILWSLGLALSNPTGFNTAAGYLAMPLGKVIVLAIWMAVAFHLCAGLRHIVMDMGWGESLRGARLSAMGVMILSAVLVILGGIWLW
jgi:succinate dehydrogenase / fumarate reductase cytochrome b subunit